MDVRREHCRLANNTSIFVAELHAILMALSFIEKHKFPSSVICSDSKSVLQSLLAPSFSHHFHFQIYALHESLSVNGIQITFLWVPSHCGILGNEAADRSARESLSLSNVTDTPANFDSIKSLIRSKSLAYWEAQWQAGNIVTQLHSIKPNVNIWTSSFRKNRREEKMLSRLRIGHTYLTHSFLLARAPQPFCVSCRCSQSVSHFILDCHAYHNQRQALVDYCQQRDLPFSLPTILGDGQPALINMLFVFLKTTGLIESI